MLMLMVMREILTLMLALWPRLTAPPENGKQRRHNIPLFTSVLSQRIFSENIPPEKHWQRTYVGARASPMGILILGQWSTCFSDGSQRATVGQTPSSCTVNTRMV